MKLKRLSLFLALVMILSAFAGTFTFASAETTNVWEVNGETYATLKDALDNRGDATTIYLTGDYTVAETATVYPSIPEGTTITITSKNVENPVISNKAGIRFLQLTTAGTLKLQNLTLNTPTGISGAVQINAGIVELDNVVMNTNNNYTFVVQGGGTLKVTNGSKLNQEGVGQVIRLNEAGATAIVDKSTITRNYTAAGTPALIYFNASSAESVTSCTITDSKLIVNAATASSTTGSAIGFNGSSTPGAVLSISGSIVDVSNAPRYRAIYMTSSAAAATFTFANTWFKGAVDTNDVMQVSTNVAITIGENVGFTGGAEQIASTAMPLIIRNYSSNSIVYDNYNAMKVYNNTYATATDFFVAMGATKLNGTNYDEVAASLGYKVRIGDAATAYNSGSFSGYYTSIRYALKNVAAGNTITLIDDTAWGANTHTVSKALTIDLNGYTLSSKGTYCRFANMEANLTIKNGTFEGVGGSGNVFQMQNTAKGIELTFEDVTIKMPHGSGTTSFIMPLGQNQVVNFKGNITVTDTGATHALVYLYGSNSTVNFTDGEFTVVGYSRVVYGNTSNHDGSGDIDGLKFNVTNAVLRTDAWGGVFQNSKGTATVTLKNADIMTPASNQFLRLSAGASATVNGETVTAEAETYYMPTSQMLTGASVRIAKGATAENLTESGIRFESTLSADIIAAVGAMIEAGTIKNATIGTVVFKKADLGSKSVAQLVRDANADANDDLIVADIEAKNGIVENADGSATIRAAIINIKEKNYGVEFGAVAYIEYEMADGEIVRIYGNYNSTNHTRSIKAVAENALADTKTAEEIEANGSATFDGYNYYNEIAEGVFSCYSDEQIAILNTYAGK